MDLLKLVRRTFSEWQADNPTLIAAGLSFFSIFSLAPILLIAIAVTGRVFRTGDAQALLIEKISEITSPRAANAISSFVDSLQTSGDAGSLFGIALLLWAASRVVGQLQGSLRIVWKAAPPERHGWKKWGGLAVNRARALAIALGFQFILIGFLLVDLLLASLQKPLMRFLPELLVTTTLPIASFSLSFVIFAAMFSMTYRWLPETRLDWPAIMAGGVMSSVLFTLGRYALTLYFRFSDLASASGAAGSIVIILLWVYFSAHVFLFGAEFAWVFAHRHEDAQTPSTRKAARR